MSVLGFQLSFSQAVTTIALLSVGVVSGLVHWVIVARVSRLRAGAGIGDRLLPFGFGDWHVGVLRRSWYPEVALPLRRWALLTYAFSVTAVFAVAVLLMVWVVF